MKGVNRLPFNVASHKFDLSHHRQILLLAETKELMPTVIRLAELYQVAAPSELPTITLSDREEILDAITIFLNFVDKHHFPLYLDLEEEEILGDERYHPWLSEIPAKVLGFATHDIEPDNYGDLVRLLARLETVFDNTTSAFGKYGGEWSQEELNSFRLEPICAILEEMNLPPPLDGLSSLIKMVLHDTDTFYLDGCPICPCSGPDFKWTVKNFKWLQEDWLLAKPIYKKSQKLIKWSNNNQERLKEVSAILKKAHSIHMFYKDGACPEWF